MIFAWASGGFMSATSSLPLDTVTPHAKKDISSAPIKIATRLFLGCIDKFGLEALLHDSGILMLQKVVDDHKLLIFSNGKIFIDGEYVCIQPNIHSYRLPHADILLSKIACLVNEGRKSISTIEERHHEVLNKLFPLPESQVKFEQIMKEVMHEQDDNNQEA